MTPVGIISILVALVAAYQIATRGPGLMAAAMAVMLAVIFRTLSARAAAALDAARREAADPWARPSRREKNLLARDFRNAIRITTLTSMFPEQTVRGYAIARGLRLA